MHLLRELFRRRMSHPLHLHRAFIPWRGCDVTGQCIPGRSGLLKGRKVASCVELHFPRKETLGSSAFEIDQFSDGRAMA